MSGLISLLPMLLPGRVLGPAVLPVSFVLALAMILALSRRDWGTETLLSYRCRQCGHAWHKVEPAVA